MTTERDWVKEIGEPAYAGIKEMVAALECDYDRLEELRDERDDYDPDAEAAEDETASAKTWAEEFPDAAEELKELEEAAGECNDEDEARERIQDDALSVQVRSGWVDVGEDMTAEEFEILLTTGGPAVRILGELDEHREPTRAWLEVQDWGKPWTEFHPCDADVLLAYCRVFHFGE